MVTDRKVSIQTTALIVIFGCQLFGFASGYCSLCLFCWGCRPINRISTDSRNSLYLVSYGGSGSLTEELIFRGMLAPFFSKQKQRQTDSFCFSS